jgi:hypothetical protein
MRTAVRLLFGSLAVLFTTMLSLRIFFTDVKPIAWSEVAQSSIRLEAAFFLLIVENIAAFCFAVASIAMFVLWVRRNRIVSSECE